MQDRINEFYGGDFELVREANNKVTISVFPKDHPKLKLQNTVDLPVPAGKQIKSIDLSKGGFFDVRFTDGTGDLYASGIPAKVTATNLQRFKGKISLADGAPKDNALKI